MSNDPATPVPAVSVTMPTYKRPDMLRRAIDSVMAQTLDDWELIVTDDEDPPGETWAYLGRVAASDPRVRILRNPGPRGQIGNNNFALRQARGAWVKPLFDDDGLKPTCLERMLEAAEAAGPVWLVRCLADRWEHDRKLPAGDTGHATLERLDPGKAALAMYLQDLEIGTPVQALVRREAIEAGLLWEDPGGMQSGFDTWWLYRVAARGGLALLNEPLVDQHLGHETGTSQMQRHPEKLDEVFLRTRELMRPLISTGANPPSLAAVRGQVRLIRAMVAVRDRRWTDAVALTARVWSPASWALAWRWVRRRRGRPPAVRRDPLPWPAGDER